MWTHFRYGMMAVSALVLSGCWMIGGDDDGLASAPAAGGARSYAASGFDEVTLASGDNIVIRHGAAFSVVASGPAATLDQLVIRLRGEELSVRRQRGTDNLPAATITVTMPLLKELTLAGSGNATADKVDGNRAEVTLAGSGQARIATVAARNFSATLAGSGSLAAAGRADRVDVNIVGSGSFAAPMLTAARADINVAGSGDVSMAVTGPAAIAMVGSGDVTLTGGARCTTSNVGSGAVRCS